MNPLDKLRAENAQLREELDKVQVQRDQVLHLLSGGTLTENQVEDSGLGRGVISEQRHHNHMLARLHEAEKLLRETPWLRDTLTLHDFPHWITRRNAFINPPEPTTEKSIQLSGNSGELAPEPLDCRPHVEKPQ